MRAGSTPSAATIASCIERFMWIPQTYEMSSSRAPERSTAPRAAATKFASETSSSPFFIDAGSATSRKCRRFATLSSDGGSTEPPAGTFTCSANEPSVIRVRGEHEVLVRIRDEEPGDRPVAEVEHEARPLVPVVEQVRLAARRDDEGGSPLGLGDEQRPCGPKRHRRPHRDVVVLDRVGPEQPNRCAIQGAACQTA